MNKQAHGPRRLSVVLVGPVDLRGFIGDSAATGLVPRGLPALPVASLAMALAERGHSVTIVTTSTDITEAWEGEHRGVGIRVAPARPKARARALDRFRQEIREISRLLPSASATDVVHAHWTYEYSLAALQHSEAAVVTAHDSPFGVVRQMPDAYRILRLTMALEVRRRVAQMTAVSPAVRDAWRRHLLYRDPIEVIPNIAPELPPAAPQQTEVPILAAVGNPTSLKNLHTLVDALPLIRSHVPGVELHIAGPGLEADSDFARRHSHPGVIYQGPQTRQGIADLLARATVFVHPSLQEAQPVAVLEAMSSGVPVIAGANTAGCVWTLGDAGVLTDVSDPRAIAREALRLIDDASLRRRLSNRGLDVVRDRFSPSVVAAQYLAQYCRVL